MGIKREDWGKLGECMGELVVLLCGEIRIVGWMNMGESVK